MQRLLIRPSNAAASLPGCFLCLRSPTPRADARAPAPITSSRRVSRARFLPQPFPSPHSARVKGQRIASKGHRGIFQLRPVTPPQTTRWQRKCHGAGRRFFQDGVGGIQRVSEQNGLSITVPLFPTCSMVLYRRVSLVKLTPSLP